MEFEKCLEVLEKIASEFPKGSDEYEAMELAAKSMHYVRHEDVGRQPGAAHGLPERHG